MRLRTVMKIILGRLIFGGDVADPALAYHSNRDEFMAFSTYKFS